jgi:N-acetylmuramoyl-L-alanine amidase
VSLQPYLLQGVSITIDASPATSGTPDISLEVAKRLRSLLEASGALVTMLRTGGDTSTADAVRAQKAAETTATAAVGFDLSPPSTSGRLVESPSVAEPAIITDSARLASAVTSELVLAAPPARSGTTAADAVLSATNAPFVRVRLGSPLAREDQALFADPTWADKVARAVYTALGKMYGAVEQP